MSGGWWLYYKLDHLGLGHEDRTLSLPSHGMMDKVRVYHQSSTKVKINVLRLNF